MMGEKISSSSSQSPPATLESLNSEEDLHAVVREKEEDDKVARILRPYCQFLVRWPGIIIGSVIIALIGCIVLSVIPALGSKDFPDFSVPTKGFEPRGTDISKRFVAYDNLWSKKWGDYILTNNPKSNYTGLALHNNINNGRRRRTLSQSLNLFREPNLDFFLIYKSGGGGNLLTPDNMNNLCRLYRKYILQFPCYSDYFETLTNTPHHLPNYIAALAGQPDCDQITQSDVNRFKSLLTDCVVYYKNSTLKDCISQGGTACQSMRRECQFHNNLRHSSALPRMIYNTFHYLTDIDFQNRLDHLELTGSTDFLSWIFEDVEAAFFEPVYRQHLKDTSSVKVGDVQLVAFNMFRFKFHIFQSEIIIQSLFIIAAIVLIILFIWFYSGSIFVGLMTLACILIALAISYFVYGRVFDMNFFPFLNMITLIFIVGIGADDAFVYTGIWGEARNIYPLNRYSFEECLIKWTTHAIRHALLAMLVTSLTTASAFYANVSSVVTSVKCFGLFAGTAIIVNYLLMITFFPAIVVVHEKYLAACMHSLCPGNCKNPKQTKSQQKMNKLQAMLDRISDQFFNNWLRIAILKLRYFWIVILLLIGIGGCVVTFGKPGLNPPSTGEFQMFTSSSPLEQYDLTYKKRFASGSGSGSGNRRVFFFFGLKPVDNGNKFDPDNKGTIELHNYALDLGNVQTWLHHFCKNLEQATFVVRSDSCSRLDTLFTTLTGACASPQQTMCCNLTLPISSDDFMRCFLMNVETNQIGKTMFDASQPIFDHQGDLKVIQIVADTTFRQTDEFEYNQVASKQVGSWFDNQYSNITSSQFEGWWYIHNQFYDLQLGLFEGTKASLGIAIAVAFLVILFTTFNLVLSLYSIVTITFIISVTVGILILSGWRLNILESIVFSVAAGLSADFTLHYSVAYQTSLHKNDRIERVKGALSHIGPAILMGACTTFIAGVVMTPSQVLVYIQMSQFLMLVMFVSWLFSTFFFLPLCAVIGPTGNVGQLTCKKVRNSVQRRNRSSHTGTNNGTVAEVAMEPLENNVNVNENAT